MPLPFSEIHKLTRWNTPTIANAIEQITSNADPRSLSNLDEARSFTPELGSMCGYAVTLVISGGDPKPKREQPKNFSLYREYLASLSGPKIVVVQDIDRPACYGSIWGEVGAATALALGCVGTIVDGAVRDIDEMRALGFNAIARRLAVSHAHCWPLLWGVDVEVFGTPIKPGQLIHADKHGFTIIPDDSHDRIVEAARTMDDLECETVITAARTSTGLATQETLAKIDAGGSAFGVKVAQKFCGKKGEWA